MTNSVERVSISTTPSTQAKENITDDSNRLEFIVDRPHEVAGIPIGTLNRYGELRKIIGQTNENGGIGGMLPIGAKMSEREQQIYMAQIEICLLRRKYPNIENVYLALNGAKFFETGLNNLNVEC